jgi:hypothetical protein
MLKEWNRLGWQENADSPIYTYFGNADEDSCDNLAAFLREHIDATLIIIETLDDLLKIENIKENTASRKAFEEFQLSIMESYSSTMSFLALWHLKKGETEFAGDGILGASVIRGRTDAKIFLSQVSEGDDRRIISTTKRIGRPIPKTYLVFDPLTKKSVLGQAVEDEYKIKSKGAEEDATNIVLDFIANNPGCGMRDAIGVLT